jgi:hypothetical protein
MLITLNRWFNVRRHVHRGLPRLPSELSGFLGRGRGPLALRMSPSRLAIANSGVLTRRCIGE